MKKTAVFLTFFLAQTLLSAQGNTIKNDQFWNTISGRPIYSQGGGVFRFPDPETKVEKYYWYGAHYKEAEYYRKDPAVTHSTDSLVAISCYSSTDLVNWTFENNSIDRDAINRQDPDTKWMGRLGVAYIADLEKYALFVQHNKGVLVALGETPTGTFTWHQKLDMTQMIGTPNTGDQTVFTDDDTGKSYLVYSYGEGRHKIYISEIGVKNGKVGLLDCHQVYSGKGREGNCMFKYKGKYYVYASNLYGWDSSYAYYLVSDKIYGPYTPEDKMLITPGCMDDFAHITQTGFFINVKGSKQETVVYCGDRWANFAGNGLGYNQWLPMSFDGDTPYLNSLSSWKLNEATGEWWVAKDNNYVKNGSLEADRRKIPSPVKPIQEHITGWFTKVYQGNPLLVGDADAPESNYFNSEEDRKSVVGEKSLNLTDNVPFKRKVFQVIESTPYVMLEDGRYDLKASIKNNGRFHRLEMFVESGGLLHNREVPHENKDWVTISLTGIHVRNGRAAIGFYAHGAPGASCQIDDVVFTRTK
ncbi:family 43 glycosylhydrolase [Galbibacter sp. PAP.153]|uniref:family 43 glycosylhydrolase n=1 Tax=Galbibacter sp. PAP.153 TaxID=3104623 RepID=UPI003009E863